MTRHPRDRTHPLEEAIVSIIVTIMLVIGFGIILGGIIHIFLNVLERGL